MRQGIKKPRLGLGFPDGAKRTRTADPLHAMQVLYQLSYGPVGDAWRQERWSFCLARMGPCLAFSELTTRRARYTWRQTATSLPCTATCSAGSTRGS